MKQTPNRETVFLSGTDRVADIMNRLSKYLARAGFRPIWFRRSDFPILHKNAMDACIAAARTAERLIMVVEERSGLIYAPLGITISEAEFEAAYKRGVPCLVFVRARLWHQARIYHRHLGARDRLTPNQFRRLRLDGDQETYSLIERLMHRSRRGKPEVPWIVPFELDDQIVEAIKEQWILPRGAEAKMLASVTRAISPGNVPYFGPDSTAAPAIYVTPSAMSSLRGLSAGGARELRGTLLHLQQQLAAGKLKEAAILRVRGRQGMRVLDIGRFVLLLRADKSKIVVVAVSERPALE